MVVMAKDTVLTKRAVMRELLLENFTIRTVAVWITFLDFCICCSIIFVGEIEHGSPVEAYLTIAICSEQGNAITMLQEYDVSSSDD